MKIFAGSRTKSLEDFVNKDVWVEVYFNQKNDYKAASATKIRSGKYYIQLTQSYGSLHCRFFPADMLLSSERTFNTYKESLIWRDCNFDWFELLTPISLCSSDEIYEVIGITPLSDRFDEFVGKNLWIRLYDVTWHEYYYVNILKPYGDNMMLCRMVPSYVIAKLYKGSRSNQVDWTWIFSEFGTHRGYNDFIKDYNHPYSISNFFIFPDDFDIIPNAELRRQYLEVVNDLYRGI